MRALRGPVLTFGLFLGKKSMEDEHSVFLIDELYCTWRRGYYRQILIHILFQYLHAYAERDHQLTQGNGSSTPGIVPIFIDFLLRKDCKRQESFVSSLRDQQLGTTSSSDVFLKRNHYSLIEFYPNDLPCFGLSSPGSDPYLLRML